MRMILPLICILMSATESAGQGRCEFWFDVAGNAMEMRQREVPLDQAVKKVLDYNILDRYLVRGLIERAYELPRKFTENGKQAIIEEYAWAARYACNEGLKERGSPERD